MAREHLTVALAGDGGDEALAGYERTIRAARTWAAVPAAIRRRWAEGPLSRTAALEGSPSLGRAARHLAEALAPAARAVLFPEFFAGFRLAGLYREEVRQAVRGAWEAELLARWRAVPPELSEPDAAMFLDYEGYLPETLLVKMDIASMANSLEIRAPFLDQELVEFAATLPAGHKVSGGVGKVILREMAAGLLPADILAAPKRGFSAPVSAWLRGALRSHAEALLVREPEGLPRFFRPEAVRALWEAHQSGRENHAMRLWALLALEVWYRTWMGTGRG
jgi:asparagine synthase (glutamine-hydrolysing)